MKKLLAFLLCVLTVFQLIIPTIAADGQELKKISVFNGLESKLFTVIEKDGEIYSTVDDLRWIFEKHVNSEGKQRFVLTENETNFVFNLGEKYVIFSKDDKKILVKPVSYTQDYSGTLIQEGKYYYPLSEILPWMNVECSVDNGTLVIKPDMKSVWEISKEIKQDNYQFNILNELGDSTSTVAALVAAHVIDGFFAVFRLDIDRLIIIDDEQLDSWHTVNTYYDCLIDMATDDFMVSEQAEKVLKNIKTVNKFDESIRDLFDMTNADVDIESILSGYETDKTKSADYAEMCNQFKMASDIADLAKGIDKVLPVLKTIEATSHVIPGYFDALISQQNNPDNSMAYQLALDRSVTTLKGKLPAIFTGITDFVLTGAFEDLGSALEKDYSKIFFVEGFSGAVGVVENVLTLVWPVNKAASDVAKLSVYYDIQHSSFVTANKYKFEATSVDNVHLMRVNYMLSLLASKKSYEAMKKVLDLISQGFLKQYDIDKIDLMLVELAYAESAEENDAVCDKSDKIKDIKNRFKDISVFETNSMNFVGTYWSIAFGPSMGGQYRARFEKNGELLALGIGSGEFKEGTYTYTDGSLFVKFKDGSSMDSVQINENEFKSKNGIKITDLPNSDLYYGSIKRIKDDDIINDFEHKEFLENNKNTVSDKNNNYEHYSGLIGKTTDDLLTLYPSAEFLSAWQGYDIYSLGAEKRAYITDEEEVSSIYVSISDIFSGVTSNMSKKDFEILTGVEWKISSYEVPLEMYKNISGYILSSDVYNINVICESNGTILSSTARCQIF